MDKKWEFAFKKKKNDSANWLIKAIGKKENVGRL